MQQYGTDPVVKVPLIPISDCEQFYGDMLQQVRKVKGLRIYLSCLNNMMTTEKVCLFSIVRPEFSVAGSIQL